jgi:hypothetical protein
VAAAVPEVPEGAPKLKAMSREQRERRTKTLLPRRDAQRTPLFRPAGKLRAVLQSSASYHLAKEAPKDLGAAGGGSNGNAPDLLTSGMF